MQESVTVVGAACRMDEVNEGASSNQVPNLMTEVNIIYFEVKVSYLIV